MTCFFLLHLADPFSNVPLQALGKLASLISEPSLERNSGTFSRSRDGASGNR